jgi:hypothetical protein
MQAWKHRFCTTWLALLSLLSACEWTPSAGPVKPERLARGDFAVRGMLDNTRSRFAWVVRREEEERDRHFIFDIKARTSCELPERTYPLLDPLTPPTKWRDAAFLWPLLRQAADLEESVVFVTERCKLVEFSSTQGTALNSFPLDGGRGTVLLANDRQGRLAYVDPWREKENLIATGVGMFREQVNSTTAAEPGPQALWLIEDGRLRLRELDGTLRVSIGEKVSAFTQGAFSQPRIAFIAAGDLYEAVAPQFQPVLLARDACTPFYSGTLLSFASPCADRQLVRIDLTTGSTESFAPGVVERTEQRGLTFERQRNDAGELDLFVTFANASNRIQIVPPLERVQVLSSELLVGVDAARRFGVWSPQTGFQPILKGLYGLFPFMDARTNTYLWLAHHDVKDQVGRLSLLEQSKLELTELATGVPASGGYSFAGLQQVPEPVLIVLRDAKPAAVDEMGVPVRFRGTLEVRLVSGDLPSEIDAGVSSYTVVYDPEAGGLLYAIEKGDSQGLWFAAL